MVILGGVLLKEIKILSGGMNSRLQRLPTDETLLHLSSQTKYSGKKALWLKASINKYSTNNSAKSLANEIIGYRINNIYTDLFLRVGIKYQKYD